jgi:hypothetical protein
LEPDLKFGLPNYESIETMPTLRRSFCKSLRVSGSAACRRIWRILRPTKPGIFILFIFGIELLAVGIAAMSIRSTSPKYFSSDTTKAEKKFQKLKYRSVLLFAWSCSRL